MDSSKLIQLITHAIEQGVISDDALNDVDHRAVARSSKVSTANLLSTYRRRLRHTGNNPTLLQQTEQLVAFLESYTHQYVSMISVYTSCGGYRALLATSDESEVIYWPRMLDQACNQRG